MKLTTTLQRLKDAGACTKGYRKLAKHLGGCNPYGMDKPINLLTILESNGVADMLWCLRATEQPETQARRIASQLAIEFAAEVLPIFEALYPDDQRPRKAIQVARDYLAGTITIEQLRKARMAAYAAAYASAYAAASASASAAAAAAAAAYAAAYAATAAYADEATAAYAAASASAAAYADEATAAYAYADEAAYAYADEATAAYAAARSKAIARQSEIIRAILTWEDV